MIGQQAGNILAGFAIKSLFYAIKCQGAALGERGELSWHHHCQRPWFAAAGSAGAGASYPCAGAQPGCLQASHTGQWLPVPLRSWEMVSPAHRALSTAHIGHGCFHNWDEETDAFSCSREIISSVPLAWDCLLGLACVFTICNKP